MSSTKLTGLSANAGSGSDNDDEAKPSSSSSTRSIVVAIEKTDDGLSAVKFAAENVLKGENDTLHIVHIAKIMSAREEISHGIPGTSLSYRDESLGEVKAHVEEARAWLRDVIVPAASEGAARAGGAAVRVHLFVDKTTASSDDLASTLAKAADDLDASVLVLSKSNKTRLDRLFVGSVAGKTQKICGRPVLLVTSGGGGGGGAGEHGA